MISSNMKKSYYDRTCKVPGCGALSELRTTFKTFLLGLTPEEDGGELNSFWELL